MNGDGPEGRMKPYLFPSCQIVHRARCGSQAGTQKPAGTLVLQPYVCTGRVQALWPQAAVVNGLSTS